MKDTKYLAIRLVFAVETALSKIRISNEHTMFGWYAPAEALELPLLPGTKEVLEKIKNY